MKKSSGALLIVALIVLFSSISRMARSESVTALAKSADSMAPGTWAKLPTLGLTHEMIFPGDQDGILPYSMNMVWDSTRHVGYFFGGEHNGVAVCGSATYDGRACADSSQRFLKYDEATNTWSLQLDSVTGKPHSGIAGSHADNGLTIDPATGDIYKIWYGSPGALQRFSRAAQSWSSMATPTGFDNGYIPGFAWYPEANGAVLISGGFGQIAFWNSRTNSWSTLFTGVVAGTYPDFAIYNPIFHHVLLGGGGGVRAQHDCRNIYLLSYNRSWSISPARKTPDFKVSGAEPFCMDSDGLAGHVSLDPVTGKYIVITRGEDAGMTMYEYDSQSDKWTHLTGSHTPPTTLRMGNPAAGGADKMASVAIPERGVIMYLNETSTSAEVWLYKPGQKGNSAPISPPKGSESPTNSVPENTSIKSAAYTFSQKCAMPGVLKCKGFDDQKDLVYFWPTPVNTPGFGDICNKALGGKYSNHYYDPLAASPANVRATVANGQCVYPEIDSSIKYSGSGSLKFSVPNHSTADSSGEFSEPFKRYPDGAFGYVGPQTNVPTANARHEGNVLFIQWRQRIDSGMLTTNFKSTLYTSFSWVTAGGGATKVSTADCNIPSQATSKEIRFQYGSNFLIDRNFTISSVAADGCSITLTSSPTPSGIGGSPIKAQGSIGGGRSALGWKQFGVFGNPPNGNCCGPAAQISVNGYQAGLPQSYSYDNNGTVIYGVQDIRGCKFHYPGDYDDGKVYPEPPCIRYHANQWQEYTVRLEIRGASGQHASHYQQWIDGELTQDINDFALTWGTVGTANGLGQFNLSPYHTNKDPAQDHPDTAVWYDDVIISTKPIPMANGLLSGKD